MRAHSGLISTKLLFAENSLDATVRDFFSLTKPGVMSLVVYSALTGMVLAPQSLHLYLGFVSLLCIAAASGGAAALNMWYDRDIDSLMERTKKRPIPSGRIAPNDALSLGVLLSLFSFFMMAITTNLFAAFLLGLSIGFYIFIYTVWLKRRTPQNIVIGGAAGAFPPMIGWASATGDMALLPILLFLLIFCWTPYHFWALALYRSKDYERANVPMLPVLKSYRYTQNQITFYALLTLLISGLIYFIGSFSYIYGGTVLFLSAWLLIRLIKFYLKPHAKSSFQLFTFSIFHLFMLLSAMMIDHIWGKIG